MPTNRRLLSALALAALLPLQAHAGEDGGFPFELFGGNLEFSLGGLSTEYLYGPVVLDATESGGVLTLRVQRDSNCDSNAGCDIETIDFMGGGGGLSSLTILNDGTEVGAATMLDFRPGLTATFSGETATITGLSLGAGNIADIGAAAEAGSATDAAPFDHVHAGVHSYALSGNPSIIPTENLGTGTRNNTTFLRGDGTFAIPPGGLAETAGVFQCELEDVTTATAYATATQIINCVTPADINSGNYTLEDGGPTDTTDRIVIPAGEAGIYELHTNIHMTQTTQTRTTVIGAFSVDDGNTETILERQTTTYNRGSGSTSSTATVHGIIVVDLEEGDRIGFTLAATPAASTFTIDGSRSFVALVKQGGTQGPAGRDGADGAPGAARRGRHHRYGEPDRH